MAFKDYEDDGTIGGLENLEPLAEESQPVPDLAGYNDGPVQNSIPDFVPPEEHISSMRGSIYDRYGEGQKTDEMQDVPDDEYVAGLHDAAADGVPKHSSSFLRKFFVSVFPYIVVAVFMVWYFSDFISFSGGDDNNNVMNLQDEEYKKILAEKEDMARRLEINEVKMEQERKEMEDRFERMFRSMQESEEERQRRQAEEMDKLRQEMAKLAEQRAAQNEPEKPVEPQKPVKTEPLKGNAMKTGAYSAIQEMRERKDAELARVKEEKPSRSISSGSGLATAMMIPARLDTKIVSLYQYADNNFWIVATTKDDIFIEPNFILPKNTRFLGKARPDYAARRMVVNIERMQAGTAEIAVKGMLLDKRGNAGLVTKYVDARQQAMWSSLIPNLLSAFASSAQDLYDVERRDEDGYRYTEKRPEASMKNAALEGMASTFQDQAKLIEDINRDKPSIIIVESGIDVQVQLTEFIGSELLLENKIVKTSVK